MKNKDMVCYSTSRGERISKICLDRYTDGTFGICAMTYSGGMIVLSCSFITLAEAMQYYVKVIGNGYITSYIEETIMSTSLEHTDFYVREIDNE